VFTPSARIERAQPAFVGGGLGEVKVKPTRCSAKVAGHAALVLFSLEARRFALFRSIWTIHRLQPA
jgi:hypothetical protein